MQVSGFTGRVPDLAAYLDLARQGRPLARKVLGDGLVLWAWSVHVYVTQFVIVRGLDEILVNRIVQGDKCAYERAAADAIAIVLGADLRMRGAA